MSDMLEKLETQSGTPGRARATWRQLEARHAVELQGGKASGYVIIRGMGGREKWVKLDGQDAWEMVESETR